MQLLYLLISYRFVNLIVQKFSTDISTEKILHI